MTKKQKQVLADAVAMLRTNASKEEKEVMANNLEQVKEELPSWLTVVLKTIAYLIGLILAGAATSCAAQSLFNI